MILRQQVGGERAGRHRGGKRDRCRIDADVAIVGAGPAGSALAIMLGRKGVRTVLLDRSRFPRDKACGEGLMPAGVSVLEELGVQPHFHKIELKPGKPLFFGTYGRKLVFGLPGNPVSALVCFELFVRPAIRGLMGLAPFPPMVRATLSGSPQVEIGES